MFKDVPIVGPLLSQPSKALFGVIAFLTMLSMLDKIPGHQTVTARVIKIDAPRTCYSHEGTLRGFLGMAERSSVPENEAAGYCGVIYTSLGPLKLPDSQTFELPRDDLPTREEIWDELKAGCKHLIYLRGDGERLRAGTPHQKLEDVTKTVISAYARSPCGGGEEPGTP